MKVEVDLVVMQVGGGERMESVSGRVKLNGSEFS